jgi:hypothetical protein
MYGMRFRHAIILFCSSFVVSFIGSIAVFVRDGVTSELPRAVQGSIMFFLMWVTIYMLAMVIHDGEKTSRDEHLVGNIQTTVDDVCKSMPCPPHPNPNIPHLQVWASSVRAPPVVSALSSSPTTLLLLPDPSHFPICPWCFPLVFSTCVCVWLSLRA